MKINVLPEYVISLVERIESYGYEAYPVGGAIRDIIIGRETNDYDISTSANIENLKEIFSDCKLILTGERFGSVTVVWCGKNMEITRFRLDGAYKDRRHPDSVSFVASLEEDIKRRDFTINALAWKKGSILDFVGGISDIENKIIRAIGNPKERFDEDALRIIRALRFSSVLGFTIEENTERAIRNCKDNIKSCSVERIKNEMDKLLLGDKVLDTVYNYAEVFDIFLPGILNCKDFDQKSSYHCYDVLTHILKSVENIEKNLILRWTMIFHDIGKPETFTLDENNEGHFYSHEKFSMEIAENIMTDLKFDNKSKETILKLIKYHGVNIENNEKIIKRWLNKLGEENFFYLLKVKEADTKALDKKCYHRVKNIEEIKSTALKILEEKQCFTIKDLAINGDDLIELGLSQGVLIGKYLNIILEKVINNEVKNEKKELINLYKKIKEEQGE